FEDALRSEVLDEVRVDRRDPAEHAGEGRAFGGHGRGRDLHHFRVDPPVRIDLEIPVRLVVRLVPELHRFDHGHTSGRVAVPQVPLAPARPDRRVDAGNWREAAVPGCMPRTSPGLRAGRRPRAEWAPRQRSAAWPREGHGPGPGGKGGGPARPEIGPGASTPRPNQRLGHGPGRPRACNPRFRWLSYAT